VREKGKGMSERIQGVLHLQLVTNGTVEFMFTPVGIHGAGSSPLSAQNVDIAREDLVRTWGFTPNKARVTIEELKMNGHVHRDTDVDAAMVAKLFPRP
jgi:hypothetical protein